MPTTGGASPSSSSSTSTTTASSSFAAAPDQNPNPRGNNPMQSLWDSINKARSCIHALAALLSAPDLASLADSDRPARSLLDSPDAYAAVSAALSAPLSGSGDDPLCQWLYETFQSSDPDLRLVVLSFLPFLSGLYLSRVAAASAAHQPSLAGFEAVLLALYSTEVKARAGKPLLISVPDLSQPSLYHFPRPPATTAGPRGSTASAPPRVAAQPSIGVLSPPLEPQIAVKSTKRACIVAIALDCYYKTIALMPSRSKIDLCESVASWAGQDCSCRFELDDKPNPSCTSSPFSSPEIRNFIEDDGEVGNAAGEMGRLGIQERPNGHQCNGGQEGSRASRGSRVPLPWELLQPVLRILGHCLFAPLNPQEVKDAASMAVRCVYARASHELVPQAILATRSLIQLDKSARKTAKAPMMAGTPGTASNPNTPSKPKKPEILLVSK
ncbi:Hyccin [Cocos nucifera]|uniref:Hyccin n=1 Tax=Cocos nucifera TaxID=13894 RepID=A0A8K0IWU6_COCNU|nr:Hyccin [Cocos nucifera]